LLKTTDVWTVEAQIEAGLEQVRVFRETLGARDDLESSLADIMARFNELPRRIAFGLCRAWDLRHVETGSHVRRIGAYTEVLARGCDMAPAEATTLGQVAMLHDVGKLAIADGILTKPGPLTAAEFENMKRHTTEGARMLGGIRHPFFERAAMVARHHHERWDGSGYPDRLRGDQCGLDARIVGIADVYDALATRRCYKPAWEEHRILAFFEQARGKQFDARLVDALFESLPRLRELALEIPENGAVSSVFPKAPAYDADEASSTSTG
jgi:response regulator RpfG family c-di-GMP phosphodiesterase